MISKPSCFGHPVHHDELFRYLVVLPKDVKIITPLICFSYPFHHDEFFRYLVVRGAHEDNHQRGLLHFDPGHQ